MAMNLEAVLKIAAKVTGLQDLGALEKGLIGAEKAAGAAKSGFKAMLDSSAWQGAAVAAAGIGVALGLSVKAAIDFEESMAEVRKVVSGLESPKALQEIQEEIFGLSREIPITAQGFAEMYAAAGQAGVAREELKAFATDVSKVAIAFDMTAAEAGDAMAKLRTNLGLTQPELMDLADAANYLSNNMASTATEIVEFMLRSGSAGKQAGLSAEQTAAFGSAMVASGAQAEVAATSFNNMIKALSRGPSMTERQISALVRLGYGQADAAEMEQQLTQAVEEESRQRLDVYRNETDGALKEINRRYRDQMQILEDGWDDELSAYEDAASDRLDAQIKALERQRDAEIEASNQRSDESGTSNRNELNRIEDFYDERIDALRDANLAETKDRQRQARDNQQQVKDQLDDQKEMEIDAVQQKYDELKTIEEARKKLAIDDAKETAKAIVGELGTNMAKMLQEDAIGTIRDVFGRIKALPAEMQMSVISDLFGDEARALLPLITNTELMEQALGLVGDKSKYAGSTAGEFEKRLATTASQLQLAQNNLAELSITFGTKFLPYITKALELLEPLVTGFANLAKQFPLLTSVVGGLALAFVGLIAAAPFISGFITLLGQLATLKIGATIAGWAAALLPLKAAFAAPLATIAGWAGVVTPAITAISAAFTGFLTFLTGTILPGILAFFSGPVGWTVLAVAAVVAMVALFHEPIMGFLTWLGGVLSTAFSDLMALLQPIFVQPFIDLWNNVLRAPVTALFDWIGGYIQTSMQNALALAEFVFVTPWVNLWNSVLREPVTGMIAWLQETWQGISQFFTDNVTTPVSNAWTDLTTFIPEAMDAAVNATVAVFTQVGTTIKSILNSVLGAVIGSINSVINEINYLISVANGISAKVNGPQLSYLPKFNIPQFAEGGVVNGPTLAMVGEGGEPEYIIPQSKMAAASANYLNGARGGAVIPAYAQGGYVGGGNAQVNVTTGPVMQQGGQQYVTVADLEKAVRKTANDVYSSLRTPAGRYALGTR